MTVYQYIRVDLWKNIRIMVMANHHQRLSYLSFKLAIIQSVFTFPSWPQF